VIHKAFSTPDDLGGKVEAALREWRQRHAGVTAPERAVTSAPDRAPDPRDYLRLLRDRTAYISIRGLRVSAAARRTSSPSGISASR
jgi:hypothetical protein